VEPKAAEVKPAAVIWSGVLLTWQAPPLVADRLKLKAPAEDKLVVV
jgi:hypothetical protein